MTRFLCLFALLLILGGASAPAQDGRRVALVLGISDYEHVARLNNPVPDARAIATVLRRHGFTVFEHYDLARADLLDVLEDFKRHADRAEVAFAYYAGHGMEIDGRNVLAPRDMEVDCGTKQARRAVELDRLFEAVGGAPQQVVLLDACRDNPFPQCPTRAARAGSGFRSFSGLGVPDRALLIANSTLSGQLAADGEPGEHSPFARALIRRFESNPQLYLRDLLDLAAQDVRVATRGSQIPEITSRGGAPRICLLPSGCGADGVAPQAVLQDESALAEARRLLGQLGYAAGGTRGGEAIELEAAIRQFQARSGLPADGQLTPGLLAVLRATQSQMAALAPPGRPDQGDSQVVPAVGVFPGALEHEVGTTFKDCDLCPEMVVVPAGSYRMGAAPDERGRSDAELPQRPVTIARPFAIGRFEITFDEWEACVLEGGCGAHRPSDAGWGRGQRPVIYVSWRDAKAYVEWLRQRTGKTYRLPSEAEWEYAVRAGTTTRFATGDAITTAQANFDASVTAPGRRRGDYEGKTVPVGSFSPNPFGLHDGHGNVMEWVEDCWNSNHAGAPADGSARGGDCRRRVLKGGAWYYEADYARSAARMSFPQDRRLNIAGFRVARDLD